MNVIEAINSRHSYRGKNKPDAVEVVGEWAWINGFRMDNEGLEEVLIGAK